MLTAPCQLSVALPNLLAAQEGAPPLVATGLLQHECKLCVVNFGVRKAATYAEPLPSKERLLLVTGLRSFMARPVYSTDEHGADKHKMERFLHEGRWGWQGGRAAGGRVGGLEGKCHVGARFRLCLEAAGPNAGCWLGCQAGGWRVRWECLATPSCCCENAALSLTTLRLNHCPCFFHTSPSYPHPLLLVRPSVATVYAPICYGPLPLLAFKLDPATGAARLAASGSLRSCDPDRIVLKKIVLSGYPLKVGGRAGPGAAGVVCKGRLGRAGGWRWQWCQAPASLLRPFSLPGTPVLACVGRPRGCRLAHPPCSQPRPLQVHKAKAVVRFMFHNPDDIRWFRPVELWTKHGRRGRIREPVGTHGAMKCIFDGPVQQRDSVCMSLYKRVYPKWPEDTSFVAC